MKNINNKKKRRLDARGNCRKMCEKNDFCTPCRRWQAPDGRVSGYWEEFPAWGPEVTCPWVWRLQLAVSLTRQTAWRRRNASYAYKWSGSAQRERQRAGESERARKRERGERESRSAGSSEQEQRLKVKNVKAFVMSTSNNNKERDGMTTRARERESVLKRQRERWAEWESCNAHYIAHSESLRLCL